MLARTLRFSGAGVKAGRWIPPFTIMVALALVVTSLSVLGCRQESSRTSAPNATGAAAQPAVTAGASRPAPPPTPVETVNASPDPDATRVTNLRVSFDAHGAIGATPCCVAMPDRSGPAHAVCSNLAAYRALYMYILRRDAAAVADAARTLNDPARFGPKTEFESDAAFVARLDSWSSAVEAKFRAYAEQRDFEVFGLRVPLTDAYYDANAGGWWLPRPDLPEMKEVLGRDYVKEFLGDSPDLQEQVHGRLPLIAENGYLTPVKSAWPVDGPSPIAAFVPCATADRARDIKARIERGAVFYYLRFASRIDRESSADPGGIATMNVAVTLRPVGAAIYSTDPPEALATFVPRGGPLPDLWFLHPPPDRRSAP